MMKLSTPDDFFIVSRLEKIPFLFHGFGTRNWREKNFKEKTEWKNFKLIFLDQIHSNVIHFVDKVPDKNLKGDGMITNLPFLFLLIKTADCLPVLIVDEMRKVIAAVHCGWRGTRKRVIQGVIQDLENHYGCFPSSLLVAMGPRIGNECYEVGEDVRESFEEQGFSPVFFRPHPYRKRKYFLDLKEANYSQLLGLGVQEKNIYSIDICTHCQKMFPSFRRDGEKAGRMLSFVGMSF